MYQNFQSGTTLNLSIVGVGYAVFWCFLTVIGWSIINLLFGFLKATPRVRVDNDSSSQAKLGLCSVLTILETYLI